MALTTNLSFPNGLKAEQPLGLFINNEFVKGKAGKTFDVINPTNGKVITHVHEALEEDVDYAVDVAHKAFKTWRKVKPVDRGRMLTKFADLLEEHSEIMACIETLDNGKPINQARADMAAAAGCIRYYGGYADKIHGQVITTDDESFSFTRKEPVGVCAQIVAWNFPFLLASWKLGPALAAGNVVILKSAEQTPLTALYASQLIKQAGFPPGVVNIISGFGKTAGNALSSHMRINKIAFTGSTIVGRTIMKAAAASNLKKVTLELGGKSPNIVFDDADIAKTIAWVNFGIYFNAGQCCCAGSRIYVQEGIYDKFLDEYRKVAQKNKVGDPFQETTFQGPVVSQVQFDRIMGYIEAGKKEGAKIETGGVRWGKEGYYIEPTIISGVNEKMKIMQEEIFGPVCSIAKFKTVEDVLEKAHDTTYGLAAAVHTTNLNTALKVSKELNAGTVWVNQYNMLHWQLPFGGYRESGIGRELGEAALSNYLETKTVSINLDKTI